MPLPARTPLFFLLGLSIPALASGQELLHYKFDENYGSKVINYANASPAPDEGTIVSNVPTAPAGSWTSGVWGRALQGGTLSPTPVLYNYVNSGWNPGTLTGSLTWASWLRMNPAAPTPSLSYMLGNGSNFRVWTGGGGFLLTGGWGGTNVNTTSTAIQSMAKAGWIHVACVIDGTALKGTYYVNGIPENPVNLTAAVNCTGSAFYVGTYTGNTNVSVFDYDEFLLVNRALTAAEITTLASSSRAAHGAYGGGCGGLVLDGGTSLPTPGNFLYQLSLASPTSLAYSVGLGSNRASLGGIPLPFDLGLVIGGIGSCMVDSSLDLVSVGGSKGAGATIVPLPIPANPALGGVTLYLQTLGLGGPQPVLVSNAFSVGIGS
jgi:hypothetical protein